MGLAFGVVSGAGPVAGIYSAVWTGLCAALFGGTAMQISGPTGPIAIVMAGIFLSFADQPAAAFAIVILAGILQFALGALRLGRYVSLMPYPVISGFSTGVGCIIIVMQLNAWLGQPPVTDTMTAVRVLPASLANTNFTTLAIAALCLAACQWLPVSFRRFVPVHLSVLVIASLLVVALGIEVPHLSAPRTHLPSPMWPPILELPWGDMWIAAVVLALISSIDSLLTSITADNATQVFHNSNKELLGQGLGNILAGFLGALPGAGSAFRTMANIRGGGRTPLSGVIHSLFLLALVLGAGGLIRFVPASVLAGILTYIGLGIVDWSYIRRFSTAPRWGVLIMLTVWLIAVFISVVTAVAVGVVMASLGLVKRMADLQLESIQVGSEGESVKAFTTEEQAAYDRCEGKSLYIRLSGPLTFGAANGLVRRVANVADYETIILDVAEVPHIDESAVLALESIIGRAQTSSKHVIIVGLRSALVRAFVQFGMLPLIKRCKLYSKRLDALDFAATLHADTNENPSGDT